MEGEIISSCFLCSNMYVEFATLRCRIYLSLYFGPSLVWMCMILSEQSSLSAFWEMVFYVITLVVWLWVKLIFAGNFATLELFMFEWDLRASLCVSLRRSLVNSSTNSQYLKYLSQLLIELGDYMSLQNQYLILLQL